MVRRGFQFAEEVLVNASRLQLCDSLLARVVQVSEDAGLRFGMGEV